MLVWNLYDFIECLGVVPDVAEYDVEHTFRIERDGLRLELVVSQYDGEVFVDLYKEGVPQAIFHMRMIDCPGARYVKDKKGQECLEFAPAKSFGSRYDGESVIPVGLRVSVEPQIRVELY